jgi:hypothetical protein
MADETVGTEDMSEYSWRFDDMQPIDVMIETVEKE